MEPAETAKTIGAECLCFRSRRVSRILTRLYDEALRPLGIQATQLTLMGGIAGPGPQGQTMARLAEMLAMDPTTLSRNLRPLVNDGLAEISRLERDKRIRIIRLTPRGEQVLTDALPRWRKAQDRVTTALGDMAGDLGQRLDAATEAVAVSLADDAEFNRA